MGMVVRAAEAMIGSQAQSRLELNGGGAGGGPGGRVGGERRSKWRLGKGTDSMGLLIKAWSQAPHTLDPRAQWLVAWLEVGRRRQGNQIKESLPEVLVGKQAWVTASWLWVLGIKLR